LWTFQTATLGNFETTSLVRDNVLYVTGPQNLAWAIDARTGRQIWRYRRELPANLTACCGLVNRGFGVLGDKLFMTTLDAHLIALDMKTGAVAWDVTLDDYKTGHSSTIAPLVVKDKVIVGAAAASTASARSSMPTMPRRASARGASTPCPRRVSPVTTRGRVIRGRPGAQRLGHRRLRPRTESAAVWNRQSRPDYHSESRKGDNLYSNSLVALDADTGRLKWHYQFTPHDVHDWDATEVPILADLPIGGQTRKVVMFANRNGFYYTLDRTNGKVIAAKPFVTTTWAKEVGADGRPVLISRPHA
jgi:alcohol dehydrogenase (cytochrome c)